MLSYKGEHVTLWYGLLNGSENILPISLTIECSFPFKVSNLKDMVEQIAGTQSQMEDTVAILTDQLKSLRAFETKLNDIEQQQQELAKQQEACQRTVEAHDKDLANLKTRFDDLTTTSDPIPTDEGETNQVLLLFFVCTSHDVSAKSILKSSCHAKYSKLECLAYCLLIFCIIIYFPSRV